MQNAILKDPYREERVIDPLRIPHHIAIITDGNRRWAKTHGLPYLAGYQRGAERLTEVVSAAIHLGVKVLTAYTFSTENWTRSSEEIEALMMLFTSYLLKQKEQMIEEGVKLETIGDKSRLPKDLLEVIEEVKLATLHCDKIKLVLALNYGGRDDIRRAAIALIEDCLKGRLLKENITEALFASYLDTAGWQDPDLLIRTSGENRLSNFLLWQISYTEVYISDTLWPDFEEGELKKAICAFQKRVSRIGGS